MPSQRTMVQRIQRKTVVAHITNPLSTCVLNVPDDLKTGIRGEPFNAFDSGKEELRRYIICTTTTQNSDELQFSANWVEEGTFAVCLSLFYQFYTMHGVTEDTTVPLVYSLLRSKTKEMYEELFAATKKFNAMLGAHEVAIDSKFAVIEAIKSCFLNSIIKTAFFILQRQNNPNFTDLDWRKNTKKTQTYKLFSNILKLLQ